MTTSAPFAALAHELARLALDDVRGLHERVAEAVRDARVWNLRLDVLADEPFLPGVPVSPDLREAAADLALEFRTRLREIGIAPERLARARVTFLFPPSGDGSPARVRIELTTDAGRDYGHTEPFIASAVAHAPAKPPELVRHGPVLDAIRHSHRLHVEHVRTLLADVPAERWTELPAGMAVHPAWIVGHLAFAAQGIAGELGEPAWLPEDWASRFAAGSEPHDDPSDYPVAEELLAALDETQRRLDAALAATREDALLAPLPDPRHRVTLPTLAHALVHVLTGHAAVHVGQLVLWRRAAGLSAPGDLA